MLKKITSKVENEEKITKVIKKQKENSKKNWPRNLLKVS